MATVNYIKYSSQSRAALGRVTDYVCQDKKTEQGQLVSGLNCTPQLAAQEFTATRLSHRKESPVWFYHYTQSFSPEEKITGAQAHQVAREFAAKAWPKSEVLIATHTDAAHIHSHFIVNAVCYESGRMLRQGPKTLQHLRQVSDEICMVHGLSVVTPRQKKREGMTTREYRSATKGQSWKFRLMNTIDECMRRARSKEEFRFLMESEGYQLRWTDTRKNITYTIPDGKKCRDDRLHDEKYLKENMEYEFRIRQEIITGGAEGFEPGIRKRRRFLVDESADRAQSGMYNLPGADRADALPHGADGQRTEGDRGKDGQAVHRRRTEEGQAAAGTDHHSDKTGWEKERAALFSSPVQSPGVQSHVVAGHPGGGRSADRMLHAVAELGYSVEVLSEPDSVMDATTAPVHIDKKRWKELQEKRIATGHKPDDHEEQQNYQQRMY